MPARVLFAVSVLVASLFAAVIGVSLAGGGSRGDEAPDSGLVLTQGWAGSIRPPIPPKDFRLRDQDGRVVSLAGYRGRPVVLAFMYSTCEDTCPVQAQTIRGALDDLGRDVPVFAVSVDPADDTPARARSFLVKQRMTGRMRFLLGDRRELRQVWRDYGIQPQGQGFEHSAYVLLVDRQGRQRIGFPVGRLYSAGLVHDLRRLGA